MKNTKKGFLKFDFTELFLFNLIFFRFRAPFSELNERLNPARPKSGPTDVE